MFEAISKKVPKGFKFTEVPGTFTDQREKFEELPRDSRKASSSFLTSEG